MSLKNDLHNFLRDFLKLLLQTCFIDCHTCKRKPANGLFFYMFSYVKYLYFTCAFIVRVFFNCSFCPKYPCSLILFKRMVTCFTNLLSDTKEDESALPAFSMRGKWIWCRSPFSALRCVIRSAACEELVHFYMLVWYCLFGASGFSASLYFCLAEETSQFRSYQSLIWDLACWECFWGCSWRSPPMDPTLCLGPPGDTKVRLHVQDII